MRKQVPGTSEPSKRFVPGDLTINYVEPGGAEAGDLTKM